MKPLPLSRDQIGPRDPLRLEVAAQLAFPDGSMTASGLRREASRQRLATEIIAGKMYTTLEAIAQMRELCRSQPKAHVSGSASAKDGLPSGSFAMVDTKRALSAALAIGMGLNAASANTSPSSTPKRRHKARVIPLESRSQT